MIVSCLDGSEASHAAARWAAAVAARRGAVLRLVHIRTAPWPGWSPRAADPDVVFAMHDGAQRRLERVRDDLSRSFPGLTILIVARSMESPATALLAESHDAALTVLGSSASSYPVGISARSAAAALTTYPGVAVALVPQPAGQPQLWNDGPVMVAVGDPDQAESAVQFAVDEAALRGCDLVAVRAWNHRSLARATTSIPRSVTHIGRDERERRTLSAKVAHSASRYPEVAVLPAVRYGHAATARLRNPRTDENTTTAPQLIVVGSRGRGRIAGFLLGSPSRSLLTGATCPVAVIPEWC